MRERRTEGENSTQRKKALIHFPVKRRLRLYISIKCFDLKTKSKIARIAMIARALIDLIYSHFIKIKI